MAIILKFLNLALSSSNCNKIFLYRLCWRTLCDKKQQQTYFLLVIKNMKVNDGQAIQSQWNLPLRLSAMNLRAHTIFKYFLNVPSHE